MDLSVPIRVRAIIPKPYGIYLWNFTGACITLRQCVMNKEELSALDLIPYSKPGPGHNSQTIWNIFMKLYRCMHDIETMCHVKGRQLLLVWFLNYLPLTVPYKKPCPGHNSLTVWNIFMKLYRCMHDIETMCHEKERELLLVWFLNYLPLT